MHSNTSILEHPLPHWFYKNVTQLFEEQVVRNPSHIAVKSDGQVLTYSALNAKANQLAHFLLARGIKPHDNIAIAFHPSIERIIVVLAVLKVGCTYVPLDIEYPPLRIQSMLVDSEAKLLITHSQLIAGIKPSTSIEILNYDNELADINAQSAKNISISNPSDIICIIYTSGSTGKPKGVCLTHLGVMRLVLDTHYINISSQDVFSQLSNFAFDAILFEMWGALLNGASLVIFPKEILFLVDKFEEMIKEYSISIMFTTTQLFNTLCLAKTSLFSSLKYLLVAGEVANPRIIQQLLQSKHKPTYLLNLYGPTENTTFTTAYLIQEVKANQSISIGKPISHTECYILDKHLHNVRQGEIGELYVGGFGLAKGYLNNKKLSDEKFIVNPFNHQMKLYKTGDQVKLLPDGNLEFIGRIDNQVKIRGFRIELDEISHALLQYPGLSQAVVIVKENTQTEKTLIAYLVFADHASFTDHASSVSVEALQQFLSKSLPPIMIPNIFVMLKHVPMTPNGKINKKALPPPNHLNMLKTTKVFQEAITTTEKKLAVIWSKALQIDDISIDDHFFNLGGHSLLLTQILLEIKEQLGVNLSLKEFYDYNTIRKQSHVLDKKLSSSQANLATSLSDTSLSDNTTHLMQFDAILDNHHIPFIKSLAFSSSSLSPALKHVLVTGAAGFVGIHLLYELLRQTSANIYCLIRGKNEETILTKLKHALEKYQLHVSKAWEQRIIPIKGDLCLPQLGLTQQQWQRMAETIDVIYHNGAHVHHTYPYTALRAANVMSTVELIKLASLLKVKPIHYISTVGAAVKTDGQGLLAEDFPDDEMMSSDVGYYQTKWVSERLLTQLKEKHHPVAIYRLGRITGQSQTGICNFIHDHFQLFVKGCTQMHAAPDLPFKIDMAPVDIVANMIVSLSLDQASINHAFNIYNDHFISWNVYMNWLNHHGFTIQALDFLSWLDKLKKQTPSNALYPLIPFYLENNYSLFSLENPDRPLPNNQNTVSQCKVFHLQFPNVDDALLDKYIAFLIHQHFL